MMRRKRMSHAIALAFSAALATGCANMDKEQLGTIIGAAAGGIIGKKVGGDRGAAIGVLVGGAIGNRIGAHLDEEDRKKLAALEQRALESGQGGSFVTNKTKATVSVIASEPTLEAKKPFVLSESLTPYPIVLVDPSETAAYVETPVFSSLDEKRPPRMVIQRGVAFTVAANVRNEPWALVGDSNVGIGYVPLRYLQASIAADPTRYNAPVVATTRAPSKAADPKTKAVTKTGVAEKPTVSANANPPPVATSLTSKEEYDRELSRLRVAYPAPSTAPAAPAAVAATPAASATPAPRVVQASFECKVVVRKVDTGKGDDSFTETVKYCKEPPKGWQTQVA